jgi:hypothetical protein
MSELYAKVLRGCEAVRAACRDCGHVLFKKSTGRIDLWHHMWVCRGEDYDEAQSEAMEDCVVVLCTFNPGFYRVTIRVKLGTERRLAFPVEASPDLRSAVLEYAVSPGRARSRGLGFRSQRLLLQSGDPGTENINVTFHESVRFATTSGLSDVDGEMVVLVN